MIFVRSPLRISLGGGGTDLPSYFIKHEGFLIAAAIDIYVYVNVMRPFSQGIYLKYSKLEQVSKVEEVEHKIIREALKMMKLRTPQIEITTLADIPAGTGLGSSGSFTTALLKALYTHHKRHLHQNQLAELACTIEIDKLGEHIGKQDQYISSIGGITSFTFHKDNKVSYAPLKLSMETQFNLEDKLLLFFTGFSRNSSNILKDQKIRSIQNDSQMLENLHYVKELGFKSKKALEAGKIYKFGEILNEHWNHKKNRSKGMTNKKIDDWYELALNNGAIGGKLVGAGGGGFLMFLAKDTDQLRNTMTNAGLEEVRFRFDFEGTKVVLS